MHKKRAVAAAATTAIALLGAGVGAAVAEPTPLTGTGTTRMYGIDRFATAVDVSKKSFKAPQGVVYVASGESFADALAAGPAAAWDEAPVLLVQKDRVPAVVKTELDRLKPQHIVVLGGTGAISASTYNTIATYATTSTQRIYGTSRYGTAEAVAKGWQTAEIGTVYLASGENFADALGGGAAAAADGAGGALLLTAKDRLPAETKRALLHLKPKSIVVLGGTGAISKAVADAVKTATGVTPERVAGSDRYETAAMVAYGMWGETGAKKVFFASGTSFPDALAATSAAFINDAPIMLTKGTCTPMVTALTHDELAPDLTVFLGGPSVTYGGSKIC